MLWLIKLGFAACSKPSERRFRSFAQSRWLPATIKGIQSEGLLLFKLLSGKGACKTQHLIAATCVCVQVGHNGGRCSSCRMTQGPYALQSEAGLP